MKLRAFHASDGDCLLVSNDAEDHHILIDGGKGPSFVKNTLPALTMPVIDVVCVSHIDEDHIAGIVEMFDIEVQWRRHEFELSTDPGAKPPKDPRPPEVKEVWHNALFELVGDDLEVKARNALALTANVLRAAGAEGLAASTDNLANGEASGMELARRVSRDELNIALNKSSGGKLLTVDTARGRRIGGLTVTVLGPSQDDIDRLRDSWQDWLDDNPARIEKIRDQLRDDEAHLSTDTGGVAAELGKGVGNITAPNLASIILLVEHDGTSILLTGDADSAEILHGLKHHNKLGPNGFHATVLKVQHHGALANVPQEFVDTVTADHYVFCGNGASDNPEPEVVEAFAKTRLSGTGPDTDFTFWFTSSADTPGVKDARQKHMAGIERLTADLAKHSGGRLTIRSIHKNSFLDVL